MAARASGSTEQHLWHVFAVTANGAITAPCVSRGAAVSAVQKIA